MEVDLQQMLRLSARLDEQLAELVSRNPAAGSTRALLTFALCNVAREHCASQRILIAAGHSSTALSLVRLQFEALVRAIWMHVGASEEWLARFVRPVPTIDDAEPVLGPPVDAMLDTIAKKAPTHIAAALGALKQKTWRAMNSHVHGGAHAVVQALRGATPDQLIGALRNANGFSLMAVNVALMAEGNAKFAGRLREIQLANLECFPPLDA